MRFDVTDNYRQASCFELLTRESVRVAHAPSAIQCRCSFFDLIYCYPVALSAAQSLQTHSFSILTLHKSLTYNWDARGNMILNASHEITLSGLPSDVLETYVRYKKGTRAIVSWIVQYGPSKYHRVKSLSLKELAGLAASLAGVVKELPDVIHFHFRETIAARKRLSKYFRGNVDKSQQAVDTVNHEHFTTSLTQIYARLCSCCEKPSSKCSPWKTPQLQAMISENLRNHYEHLPLEEASENDQSKSESEISQPCSECQTGTLPSCPKLGDDAGFSDDELGNAIELATIVQDMCFVFDSIGECWAEAGRGNVHFAAAAFTTNVAVSQLVQLQKRMRGLESDINLTRLRQQCFSLNQASPDLAGQTAPWHRLLDGFTETQNACQHYTNNHQLSTVPSCPACIQRPAAYIQQANSDGTDSKCTSLLKVLLDNILHLVLSKSAPCTIVRNSTPGYADFGYMLSNSEASTDDLRLLFELHTLNLGYCQYLDNSNPSKVSVCRLTALRLAQQAIESAGKTLKDKTCFPCRCPQTLAYHLQNLEQDLWSYSKHKCWDLYFQSPWVAGNHILEILDVCQYYGMKLFVYRHYIGAVIHSYNILQQLAGLEKLALLEYICDQFKETFFPGGQRPTSSFQACWTRYVGARLNFKQGHKSRNHRQSWCMAIPAHAARKAAGLGISTNAKEERSGCLLFKIKQQDYHMTQQQWQAMSPDTVSMRGGEEHTNRNASRTITETSSEQPLPTFLPEVDKLFKSNSLNDSSALLDHFSVFASCVRVVADISDATHTGEKQRGMNCICFANALLTGADRLVGARKMGRIKGACWTKEEREGLLEMAKKAMRDEFGKKEVKDWFWAI